MARNFTRAMLADLIELRDSCEALSEYAKSAVIPALRQSGLSDIAAELQRRAHRQQLASQRVTARVMQESTSGTKPKSSDQQ